MTRARPDRPARAYVVRASLAGTALLALTASGPYLVGDDAAERTAGPVVGGPGAGPVKSPTGPSVRVRVGRPAPLRVEPVRLPTLSPGVDLPFDVAVENTNPWTVVLTGVEVKVTAVRSPRASADRPCGVADFRARSGRFGAVEIASGGTSTLRQARVERRHWPRIAMVDAHANQDGCQGAELRLLVRVTGTAS